MDGGEIGDKGRIDGGAERDTFDQEEVRRLFKYLAEVAIDENPKGDRRALAIFLLQCLKGGHTGTSFFVLHGRHRSAKTTDRTCEEEEEEAKSAADNDYGHNIVKPLLEPLLMQTLHAKPSDVKNFVTSLLRKEAMAPTSALKSQSSRKAKRGDITKRAGHYVISSASTITTHNKVSHMRTLQAQSLHKKPTGRDAIVGKSHESPESNRITTTNPTNSESLSSSRDVKIDGALSGLRLTIDTDSSTASSTAGTTTQMKLSLDITGENEDIVSESEPKRRPLAAHPMSCPPMYLLKQKKKWPVTPMPAAVTKGSFGGDGTSRAEIRAPPIESRREDLNFIGLSIPSWKHGASGAVTMRGSGRCFGRERRSKKKDIDRKRIARSVLLETVGSWEIYADTATKRTFYRDTKTGSVQNTPPSGVPNREASYSGIGGFLASRCISSAIREEEDEEIEDDTSDTVVENNPMSSSCSSSGSDTEQESGQ